MRTKPGAERATTTDAPELHDEEEMRPNGTREASVVRGVIMEEIQP